MAKIVCGRSDCSHYCESGKCLLRQIAIGKDFRCQNYICTNQKSSIEAHNKSVENMGNFEMTKWYVDQGKLPPLGKYNN